MTGDGSSLPYRPCSGVMLLNGEGRVFAGKRIDGIQGAWQMPQGGVDSGETHEAAAFRELEEETGISRDSVTLLAESESLIRYDLPDDLAGKIWGGRFRGQEQKWFAMRLEGPDSLVNINTEHPEFSAWSWMDSSELLESIVDFKRETYRRVFEEFAGFLGG